MYFLICLILLLGCSDPDNLPDLPVSPKDSLNILWNHKIYPDQSTGFISEPLLWGSNIIFSTAYFKPGNTIQSRNKITGQIGWDLQDPLLGPDNSGETNCQLFQNEMIWQNSRTFLNIDLNNGSILQVDKIEDAWMGERLSVLGNYLYAEIADKPIQQIDNFFIRRAIHGESWDTLLIISKEDGFTKFINTANMHIDNSGDSLLLFTVGKWNFTESRGQSDFYCYSLKDKSIKWRLKDWDKDGCSVLQPIIYQSKVYFQGHHTLYCIDIESGEQLWKYVMPEYLSTLDINQALIAENKLILKPNSHSIYALNPHTGILVWKNDESGGNVNKINYANGMIIYTANFYLFVVDIRNGKTIWKKKSPNDKGGEIGFNGFIPCGVNAQDSVIYAADEQNIMAIKMPELK
ncbi:MAG: PQQ-binding-like beta-propeller repeat protein [Saprospiraceae bacterium]